MTQPEDLVLQAVRKTVKRQTDIDREMRLAEDLGISSLAMVSIITELCDVFQVDVFTFDDANLLTLRTVGDLVTLFTRGEVPLAGGLGGGHDST